MLSLGMDFALTVIKIILGKEFLFFLTLMKLKKILNNREKENIKNSNKY